MSPSTATPEPASSEPASPEPAVSWDGAAWLNPPPAVTRVGDDLVVTAAEGSDFWRTTSYGFVHDTGHALLSPLAVGEAVEVTFLASFSDLYDQAGVLVRGDALHWIKAGVEWSDGRPQLGAVVTDESSDWSVHPVPAWSGRPVTIRASIGDGAVTVRARTDGPWDLVRLAPFDTSRPLLAGPMLCAPTRAGLEVRFTRFAVTAGDVALHDAP